MQWHGVGRVLGIAWAIGASGSARADEVPSPAKPEPPVRVEKKARPLPDGTFEGALEGATVAAELRIVVVGHLVVSAEVRLAGGVTIVLAPQALASDAAMALTGQAPGEGSHDFVRLRGGFADPDAAFGRWDGTLGNKVGGGAWSVGRR
jgi:hypothetical protein